MEPKQEIVLAVTGHRPQHLGLPRGINAFGLQVYHTLVRVAYATLAKACDTFTVSQVLTGMALGWDQAIADACACLGVPFWAVIPYHGQPKTPGWSRAQAENYHALLGFASKVTVLDPRDYPGKAEAIALLHRRNHFMVREANTLLALHSQAIQTGGTWATIRHFRDQKPKGLVLNCWQRWINEPIKFGRPTRPIKGQGKLPFAGDLEKADN